MDKDLMELKKQIDERLEEREDKSQALVDIQEQIEEQYRKNQNELSTNQDFVKLTQEVTDRNAKVKLAKDMLDILDKERKNELQAYILQCEKEKLDFKKKKEKKVIIEEVKADISNRKIEALKKRYGYMYKENEEFIPNKFHNITREISNWWNGTSDNFKKIVKGVLKVFFWGAVAILVIKVGSHLVEWIANNARLDNISK